METGETIQEALARELAEEGNIRMTGPPRLHGVFFNKAASRRDHVALFVVRDFVQDGSPRPNREIVAHGFFAPETLPEDTGRGTRARIAEVLGGAAVGAVFGGLLHRHHVRRIEEQLARGGLLLYRVPAMTRTAP